MRGAKRNGPAVAAVAASFGRSMDGCLEKIGHVVRRARERGAELVVLPEAALGGYLYEPVLPGVRTPVAAPPALRRDGPEIAELVRLAGTTVVCVGYTEQGEGDDVYSSAVCLSGDGVLGHQRKVHIPPTERGVFAAGRGFSAFDTPVGRLGMLLCYDKVFPEAARALSLDGAGIIASLAAWPVCRVRPSSRMSRDREVINFDLLDRTRALENQVVWVSANQAGRFGRLRFPGRAKVVDPDGRVLASTRSRPGTALARVDAPGVVSAARDALSHLGDRRPAAYRRLRGATGSGLAHPLPSPAGSECGRARQLPGSAGSGLRAAHAVPGRPTA